MDTDLVFEGGGVKGIGLVGAFSVLEGAGYRIHRVAGTSAGAIVGALVAAEIGSARLEAVMRALDFNKFKDKGFLDHFGAAGKLASLLFEKGVYEGDELHAWLDGLLTELGKRRFGDLRIDDPGSSLPPERAYKLVVMASDVSRGQLVRFPWDYPRYGLDPDEQLVADAVRCSMSIPFFFEPVRLKAEGPGGKPQVSFMVDGGMLSNFPIDVFDRTDGNAPRWPTFGVKLSARPENMQMQRFAVDDTFEFARAMLGTMTGFYDQMHINEPCTLERTMFVDTTGVQSTDFNLDKATQDRLFANGKKAATNFLKTWNFEHYLEDCRAH
ncbi:MAG TPA: patatin-like phospholipase family protein [Actinomycetota bacterium]